MITINRYYVEQQPTHTHTKGRRSRYFAIRKKENVIAVNKVNCRSALITWLMKILCYGMQLIV